MECVYPPVRQNSRLVFLPGRNHAELPQNWLVFLLFPKWKTASSFYYDGAVQSHLNLPMLSMLDWRSIVLPCEELDKKRASEKVGGQTTLCWAFLSEYSQITNSHPPGRMRGSVHRTCYVDQVERTSPPSWLWHLQPFISSWGTRRCSCIKSHPDIMGLVQVGWRLQVSIQSDEIPQDQSILKSCQSFPRWLGWKHICSMKWCIPNGCKWTKYIQIQLPGLFQVWNSIFSWGLQKLVH